MRNWILRRLGVICGDWGGLDSVVRPEQRWCYKPFGHPDSCRYETGLQPNYRWRLQAKGYDA